MKTQHLSLLLLILLSFFSCKKENDNNPTNNELITGVWKPIKQVTICSSGTEDSFNYNTCMQTSRTTFQSNGNYNEVFNTDIFGNCETEYIDNGSWSIDDSSLTLILNGQSLDFTIIELNANSLILGMLNDDQSLHCNDGSVISSHNRAYVRVD